MAKKPPTPAVPALDHLYIPTKDFEHAWKFWSEISGGDVTATWGQSGRQAGQVTLGGLNIVIAQEDEELVDRELGYRVQHGRPIIHFATPDVDKLSRDLVRRGASILRGPKTTHWGKKVLTVRAGEAVVAFVEVKKAKKRK
jgi:predicted enzyme related to lactoylglutathione lyase